MALKVFLCISPWEDLSGDQKYQQTRSEWGDGELEFQYSYIWEEEQHEIDDCKFREEATEILSFNIVNSRQADRRQ